MEKWGFGSAMRTYSMDDAQDPYGHGEDAMGETSELEMLRQNIMREGINILPQTLHRP